MGKSFTIDSITSGIARLECSDGSISEIALGRLPTSSKEGDVLTMISGDDPADPAARFEIDTESTRQRKKIIRGKLDRLRKRDDR